MGRKRFSNSSEWTANKLTRKANRVIKPRDGVANDSGRQTKGILRDKAEVKKRGYNCPDFTC
jgi:hypothetical protein